ncbi:hypothetical protein ACFSR7_05900 [Cohnella sp. GCM10020058]|uniref:hypothetical protein n=1 Tax=Cohnella sp. GCM10020058 TaxID=3317330 RepID=UPI00362F9A97
MLVEHRHIQKVELYNFIGRSLTSENRIPEDELIHQAIDWVLGQRRLNRNTIFAPGVRGFAAVKVWLSNPKLFLAAQEIVTIERRIGRTGLIRSEVYVNSRPFTLKFVQEMISTPYDETTIAMLNVIDRKYAQL